jgi:DUF4097 and DUF4098 domain-containing protein YvlB
LKKYTGKNYEINENAKESLDGINEIKIKTKISKINIQTDAGNTGLEASLTGTFKGFGSVSMPELVVSKKDRLIEISAKGLNDPFIVMLNFCQLVMTVTIPEKFDGALICHSGAGSLQINGLLDVKYFEAELTAGGIDIDELKTQDAEITTSAGSIEIGLLEGKGKIRSSAGNILVSELSGSADMKSSAGSVKTGIVRMDGTVKLHSSAGSVKVDLNEGVSADVILSTSAGNVNCDLPMQFSHSGKNRVDGFIGTGGHKLDLSSSAGNISLKYRVK